MFLQTKTGRQGANLLKKNFIEFGKLQIPKNWQADTSVDIAQAFNILNKKEQITALIAKDLKLNNKQDAALEFQKLLKGFIDGDKKASKKLNNYYNKVIETKKEAQKQEMLDISKVETTRYGKRVKK